MNIFARYASFSIRHRWSVILAVLVFCFAFASQIPKVKTNFSPEGLFVTQSEEVERTYAVQHTFGKEDDTYLLMYHDPQLFTPERLEFLYRLTETLIERVPELRQVRSLTNAPDFRGEDGVFVVEPMVGPPPYSAEQCEQLRQTLPEHPLYSGLLLSRDGQHTAITMEHAPTFEGDGPKLRIRRKIMAVLEEVMPPGTEYHLSGIPSIQGEYFRLIQEDQWVFFTLIGVVFLVLLAVIFKSIDGILLPPMITVLGGMAAFGAGVMWGYEVNILSTAIPAIVLVYGLADTLHVLTRYREEYALHGDQHRSLVETFQSVGAACFYTSFTTFVGFLSLLTAQLNSIRQFGLMSGLAVLFLYIVAMGLLPPLLAMLPPPKVSKPTHPEAPHPPTLLDKILLVFANLSVRHALPIVIGSVILMVGSVYLASQVRRDVRILEEIWPSSPIYQSSKYFENHFGGFLPFEVLVTTPEDGGIYEPAVMSAIDAVTRAIPDGAYAERSASISTLVRRMNRAMNGGLPAEEVLPGSREAVAQYVLLTEMGDDPELLRPFLSSDGRQARIMGSRKDAGIHAFKALKARTEELVRQQNLPPGVEIRPTGMGVVFNDAVEKIVTDLMLSIFAAFIFIGLLLAIEFRKFWTAFLFMYPNVMPVLIGLAFMTVADIELRTATAIVFSIAMGIAVDDTIHLLARYREEYRRHGEVNLATHRTLLTTGKPIVFTSITITVGFCVLLLSNFRGIFHFGLLTSVCLMSALFCDLIITPAMLTVFKVRFKPKALGGA